MDGGPHGRGGAQGVWRGEGGAGAGRGTRPGFKPLHYPLVVEPQPLHDVCRSRPVGSENRRQGTVVAAHREQKVWMDVCVGGTREGEGRRESGHGTMGCLTTRGRPMQSKRQSKTYASRGPFVQSQCAAHAPKLHPSGVQFPIHGRHEATNVCSNATPTTHTRAGLMGGMGGTVVGGGGGGGGGLTVQEEPGTHRATSTQSPHLQRWP
jgi:hypothetical protein